MSAAAMPSEIVRFEFNVPQLVAMKFAAPKILGTKMGACFRSRMAASCSPRPRC